MPADPRPDFFIVGAPKCGTTALAEYLRGHPRVFVTNPKEPHYFATDFNATAPQYVHALDDYLALFRGGEHCAAAGEASVWYLYSDVALRGIREFEPRARIIAMVRNPVEMAYSLHSQLLYSLHEDEPDFRRAWALQQERREGRHLPATAAVPAFLQYRAACALGSQVERLLEVFPREQVKIIVFDDFAASTRTVYEDVLAFLGVASDGRVEFPRVNPNTERPSRRLALLEHRLALLGRHAWLRRPVTALKRLLGVRGRLLRLPGRMAVRVTPRPPPDPAMRQELVEAFRPEVIKLADLTGRDLDHWLA